MGFIQVIESRLKQKFGADVGALSAQHLLSCNYLTEGCAGGWGIMHGFFAENGGIVSEDCAPYKTSTKGVPCSGFSSCPAIARVSRTYKLKDPTETLIQQELLRNGAVITDWLAPPFMKNYKEGIFGQGESNDLAEIGGSDQPLPNHASVIIGWGSTPNDKYWIVRNSFGEGFGMNGDMHIPRGNNAYQIESDIVAFEPELV